MLPARALPGWALLDMRGAEPPGQGPVAVLYARSDCVYCKPVTQAFDSITRRLQLAAVVVTNESGTAADMYRTRLGLRRPLALDTGQLWWRAAKLRAVPAVIIRNRNGVVRITYGDRPVALLQQALQSAR